MKLISQLKLNHKPHQISLLLLLVLPYAVSSHPGATAQAMAVTIAGLAVISGTWRGIRGIVIRDHHPNTLEKKHKAVSNEATRKTTTADVIRVIDGDTIKVRLGKKHYTVRLIGIDAPETVHPAKPVECFGKESSDYLKGVLTGNTVTLEGDGMSANKDKYNRLLKIRCPE